MDPVQPDPRPLSPEEAGVLDALLAQDFPGVDELRVQSRNVLAQPSCGCGCGTIWLLPQGRDLPASAATSPVPAEGTVLDEYGRTIGGILLFVGEGQLADLEVHSYYEPLPMPSPDRVSWFLRDRGTAR
ncbi:hypothetical protein ACFOW4_01580 [Micromonospora sp. GCM10011542]|uniref:hypothetical protein n=1 Tax=Micromonospora sp. GCM10011542 TaxID=3317337 RepID=UPI00360A3242